MIQFPLYEHFKRLLNPQPQLHINPITKHATINHSSILIASTLSKLIAVIITYPHEIIRTRLQTQTNTFKGSKSIPREGFISIAKSIAMKEGYRTFYKGLGTNLLRTVPSTALSLWTYEWIKLKLMD